MTTRLWIVGWWLLLAGSTCGPVPCLGEDVTGRLARALYPPIGRLENSVASDIEAIAGLDHVVIHDVGRTFGFHSALSGDRDSKCAIVLDLGQLHPVETIMVAPAIRAAPRDRLGKMDFRAHGFPLRYRIDAATQQDFSDGVTLLDRTEQNTPPPKTGMVRLELVRERIALMRYVRFTATGPQQLGPSVWGFALSEIMAFAKGRNVALHCSVAADTSIESDQWRARFLVDGVSPWGEPRRRQASPSRGFRMTRLPSPDEEAWVEVDLGLPRSIAEITLIGAQPSGLPPGEGYGFPHRGRVEIRHSLDDPQPRRVRFNSHPEPAELLSRSGRHALHIPLSDSVGRYVRLVSERLGTSLNSQSEANYVFALAEMEVSSAEGVNFALEKSVVASHPQQAASSDDQWSLSGLVDGYDSQWRLGTWALWLDDVERRHELENRLRRELEQLDNAKNDGLSRLAALMLGCFGMALLLLISATVWRERRQASELAEIRRQIASDLHDDVGANLAAIGMTAQAVRDASETPASLDEDLAEIHRVANETASAMRDIVWLIETDNITLRRLMDRMQALADAMLAGMDHEVLVQLHSKRPDRRLSQHFRRHVLLAWKEALANVLRHSRATSVLAVIAADDRRLRFQVTDNGRGMGEELVEGRGLKNLRYRAAEIQGEVLVTGEPGEGVTVDLQAPLS